MTKRSLLRTRLVALGVAALCAATTGRPRAEAPSAVVPLDTPTAAGSLAYGVSAGADGKAYLIWIEPAGESVHALRFSRLDGQRWTPPRDISRGSNWFVNWADHPSLTALPDGTLLAHWLVNTGRKQGSTGTASGLRARPTRARPGRRSSKTACRT